MGGILGWVYSFMGFFGLLKKQTKILILGLNQAGKSTLLMQMAHRRPGGLQPTIHPTSEELVIQSVRFVAVNFGGYRQGRHVWSDHLQDVAGVILLVDAADKKRFVEVKPQLDALLATKEMRKIPIVVLGNKVEQLHAVSKEELRHELGLGRIRGRPIELCMCSLSLRLGDGEALRWLADHI
ncbi:GTP-binding protein SAR1 [Hypoxylon rubiginosum]|uniref:GTP-binding protein SAR1 n=1 Tax=Hypoxylon rubiginosum TaxID=110542 RepID=A0ACB9YKH5_9PEZI|nr:GTP-binding protein SAR1 [Hypoxylon rubiginosum]